MVKKFQEDKELEAEVQAKDQTRDLVVRKVQEARDQLKVTKKTIKNQHEIKSLLVRSPSMTQNYQNLKSLLSLHQTKLSPYMIS